MFFWIRSMFDINALRILSQILFPITFFRSRDCHANEKIWFSVYQIVDDDDDDIRIFINDSDVGG